MSDKRPSPPKMAMSRGRTKSKFSSRTHIWGCVNFEGEGVKKSENLDVPNGSHYFNATRSTHISCSPPCLHVDLPPLLQPLPPLQEVLEAACGVGVGGRGLLHGLGRPAPLAVRPSVAVVEGLRAAALERWKSWYLGLKRKERLHG